MGLHRCISYGHMHRCINANSSAQDLSAFLLLLLFLHVIPVGVDAWGIWCLDVGVFVGYFFLFYFETTVHFVMLNTLTECST